MLWSVDLSSRVPLAEQIAGCVRRAVAEKVLAHGDRLPPAAELAQALGVDRNTVLAAYRNLRDEELVEFRRGRGVRVADGAGRRAVVPDAVARLVELARAEGYSRAELIALIERTA